MRIPINDLIKYLKLTRGQAGPELTVDVKGLEVRDLAGAEIGFNGQDLATYLQPPARRQPAAWPCEMHPPGYRQPDRPVLGKPMSLYEVFNQVSAGCPWWRQSHPEGPICTATDNRNCTMKNCAVLYMANVLIEHQKLVEAVNP